MGREFWITCVENDEVAVDAIILYHSLQKVKTTRKFLAIVGPRVTSKLRSELEILCAWIVPLTQEEIDESLSKDFDTLATILCWSITAADKLLLIHPNSIALKNCDDIFETEEEVMGVDYDPRMMLIKPCTQGYLTMLNDLEDKYGNSGLDLHALVEYLKDFRKLKCLSSTQFGMIELNSQMELTENPILAFFPGDDLPIVENPFVKKMIDYRCELFLQGNIGLDDDPRLAKTSSTKEPIAIIGMSYRMPLASTEDEFWSLLMNKQDAIHKLPSDRWTPKHGCRTTPTERQTLAGFLSCPIDTFDSNFFACSPAELAMMDPQQRLLLEVTWEALEDSSINPSSLHSRPVSIFTGLWRNDYRNLLNAVGPTGGKFRNYMGTSVGTTTSRIAHFLGVTGPNIATESGCSSSIVAVGLAMDSLRQRTSSVALAGGVNLLLEPYELQDFQGLLSPDGHCKVFDSDADGFVRAEGCGVFVLKRLSDALRDGDRIHALMRGYGAGQEGPSKSMGTPTIPVEAMAMRNALRDAGVKPQEVQFIEAHGTGTAVGDPLEVKAIAEVYSVEGRKEPLIIGSVKGNIGHTESCSGVAGMIKTILAMKYELIPPQFGLKELNPNIKLGGIPAIIPMEPVEWKRTPERKRIAGVSSFGITGTDGHVIIEEPPLPPQTDKAPPPLPGLLTISAKSDEALKSLLQGYEEHLKIHPEFKLESICSTANKGRQHFTHRATIIANSIEELVSKLESKNYTASTTTAVGPHKICFLYPGQGSQYHGMGRNLYLNSPVFRRHFDIVDMLVQTEYNLSIHDLLWGPNEDLIHQGLSSQLGIFTVEYCLTQLWASWGVKPDAVLGHSFGEYAAAITAGICSLSDALQLLVGARGKLLETLPTGKMLVVKADAEKTEELIQEFTTKNSTSKWLEIAAKNSSEQTVISGEADSISEFSEMCEKLDIKTHKIPVNHAFHSRALDPIMPEFAKLAESITYRKPNCEYISAVDGKQIQGTNGAYWARQTRQKVQFKEASLAALLAGCSIFIEVGAHPLLTPLVIKNSEELTPSNFTCIPSMRKNTSEWQALMGAVSHLYLQGVDINWQGFYRDFHCEKVSLPFYPFQRKFHWFTPKFRNGNQNKCGNQHPLLGDLVELPPHAMKIYRNFLELEEVLYIQDHKVASHVLFPAAGFLEMSVASLQGTQQGLVSISDFTISAPLPVNYSENMQIQIQTVKNEGEISLWSSIKSLEDQEDTETSWKKHSTCNFLIGEPEIDPISMDLSFFKNTLNFEHSTEELYTILATLGYHFGPDFKSLKKLFRPDSTSGASDTLTFIEAPTPTNNSTDRYQLHPVLIDGMIQSALISQVDVKTLSALMLPVALKKFTVYNPSKKINSGWVHVHSKGFLVDFYSNEGSLVASMEGVEFARTSLQAMEKLLSGNSPMTPLYMEKWKATDFKIDQNGKMQRILDPAGYETVLNYEPELVDSLGALKIAAGWGVLKTLLELGLQIGPSGTKLSLDRVIEHCGILPGSRRLLWRLLTWMEELGFITNENDGDIFTSTGKIVPGVEELDKEIGILVEKYKEEADWKLYMKYVEELGAFLRGAKDPFEIYFPRESEDQSFSAETLYNSTSFFTSHRELIRSSASQLISSHFLPIQKSLGRPLRILEIGGGTGTASRVILSLLTEVELPFAYTFTDISPAFFTKAEKTLQHYLTNLTFLPLDIEKDPLTQGYSPGEFDLVISLNVLHATRDLTETCRNLRVLLNPSGILLNAETFQPDRTLDLVVGHFEGYWRYKDLQLRDRHCVIDQFKWDEVLRNSGFEKTICTEDPMSQYGVVVAQATDQFEFEPAEQKEWILLSDGKQLSKDLAKRVETLGRMVHIVEIDRAEDILKILTSCGSSLEGILCLWSNLKWSEGDTLGPKETLNKFTEILKQLAVFQKGIKLLIVSEGYQDLGIDSSITHSWPALLLGTALSFKSEVKIHSINAIDVDPSVTITLQVDEIIQEMFSPGKEPLVAYRQGVRHVHRLQPFKSPAGSHTALEYPQNSPQFRLKLPKTNAIADLSFESFSPSSNLQPNDVSVRVSSAGLNFRDLMNVMKPTEEFKNFNSIGADFSGVVSGIGTSVTKYKIGDSVLGFNINSAPLPSHVTLPEDLLVRLPPSWTFAEGATLPTVFITVYHCLITVGQLQKGETILIHTTSGGVGLCALQVAKNIGANIIATAGSLRKREYLKALGIKHIFSSRDLKFGEEIMKITEGQGVQLVLNSLTGPGFKETSLKSCSKSARFIEMSKLNVWTPQEVKEMRPDVLYSVEDLSIPDLSRLRFLLGKLEEWISSGGIKPLRFSSFEGSDIKNALGFMERAKHIGKVIVNMPILTENGELQPQMFNDRSTYLVTGGLGGIGMEVAKWMCENGAGYLVLCGRSSPGEKALKELEILKEMGKVVEVRKVDIGSFEDCQQMFEWIQKSLPKLRGVMHVAGILSDGVIMNQTEEKFEEVLRPKVDGAMNLHRLTEGYNLEHFVMFSSATAVLGNPGQANYASGNKFLDALASCRHSRGLPALSINWGQWSEVGMGMNLKFPGFKPLTNLEGLNSLEYLMRNHVVNAVASDINFSAWGDRIPWAKPTLSDVLKLDSKITVKSTENRGFKTSEEFYRELESSEEEHKLPVISKYVGEILKSILKIEEEIIPTQGFDEMGLDSLMSIEFKNVLQQLLGPKVTLSTNDIQEGNNLASLSKRVFDLIKK